MKIILILLLAALSCTQKYTDFDLIRKVEFMNKETFQRPQSVYQMSPVGKDELKACFNQWLFFSNAEKEKNDAVPMMVRSLCPGQDFLLSAEMTETWWTTLFFTRSCVEIETKCAEERKNQ